MAVSRTRKAPDRIEELRKAATPYEVLKVAPGASEQSLKTAWRELARLVHPDRCPLPDAHDLCAKVNTAYATLSDPRQRRKYDAVHRTQDAVCPACEGRGFTRKQKGFKKTVQVPCAACDGTGTTRS